MLGLVDIITKLAETFRLATFITLPREQLATFFEELREFTCFCLHSLKALEEVESSWNLRCFQNILGAWVSFGE